MTNYAQHLKKLIDSVIAQGASDLHVSVGVPPIIRVSGNLTSLTSEQSLTEEDVLGLVTELLSPEHKERFLREREIDFSYAYADSARFRGNGYF